MSKSNNCLIQTLSQKAVSSQEAQRLCHLDLKLFTEICSPFAFQSLGYIPQPPWLDLVPEKVHHQYIYKLSLGESCFCFPSQLSQRMAFLTSWQFQKSKRTLPYLHANYLNKTYLDYFHFGLFSILCFLINFYFRNMNWSKTTKVTFVWKVKSCMFL